MKRPDPETREKLNAVPVDLNDGDHLLGRLHHLAAFLFDTRWDDGAKRVTGTLLLFLDAGRLKGCANDRDGNRSTFVTGSSLEDVLVALDEGLQTDTLEWRARPAETYKKR